MNDFKRYSLQEMQKDVVSCHLFLKICVACLNSIRPLAEKNVSYLTGMVP